MPGDGKGCFSRHTHQELLNFLMGVKNAEENGMQLEFLDAVISQLEGNELMSQAIWFANCEWDL